jgi:hypothetical protein
MCYIPFIVNGLAIFVSTLWIVQNLYQKNKYLCTYSEVDITIVFETIIPSSNLGGCTKKPLAKKNKTSLNIKILIIRKITALCSFAD